MKFCFSYFVACSCAVRPESEGWLFMRCTACSASLVFCFGACGFFIIVVMITIQTRSVGPPIIHSPLTQNVQTAKATARSQTARTTSTPAVTSTQKSYTIKTTTRSSTTTTTSTLVVSSAACRPIQTRTNMNTWYKPRNATEGDCMWLCRNRGRRAWCAHFEFSADDGGSCKLYDCVPQPFLASETSTPEEDVKFAQEFLSARPTAQWATCDRPRMAECIQQYSANVFKFASDQLENVVHKGETCLFAMLNENAEFVQSTITFIKSLLLHHQDLDFPFLIMENGELSSTTKDLVKYAYNRTHFIKPFQGQSLFQSYVVIDSGQRIPMLMSSGAPEVQEGFYHRLQLFTFTQCGTVVHFDAGDQLVINPFLRELIEVKSSPDFVGFAAASLCNKEDYFNAGLYIVSAPVLGLDTYQGLVQTILRPHRPDKFDHSRWYGDQSVLNAYFERIFRLSRSRLPCSYNYAKRWAFERNKKRFPDWKRAALIHYVSAKPWTPLHTRTSKDLGEATLFMDEIWWRAYLRDKAVIIGAGPSVQAPLGKYIDMFQYVLRVNAFAFKADTLPATGARVTHAFVHKATRPGSFGSIPKENLLLATFDEDLNAIAKRMRQRGGTGLTLSDVTPLPSYYYNGLNLDMNYTGSKHPLLGTIAIAWALRNIAAHAVVRPLFIIGFDMMIHCDSNGYEHYDGSNVSYSSLGVWHHVKDDCAFIQNLIRDGAVKVLDPFGNITMEPPTKHI